MNFVITGKAKDVFARIKEMADMSNLADSVIYEGVRNPLNETEIYIIRTEYITGIYEGVPAKHVTVRELDPEPSREIFDHSSGFEWGYPGSGPAQLALALLLDATGSRELALKYHQTFKTAFVQRWSGSWQIHDLEIIRWVSLKESYEALKEQDE